MNYDETLRWYPLRVPYCREIRVCEDMQRHGIDTFIPMCRRKVERNGVSKTVDVPVVHSLCFVRSSFVTLELLRRESGSACLWQYYGRRSDGTPLWVPDREMDMFMTVSRLINEDVLYLNQVSSTLLRGERVRVIAGPFEGVEGVVVRLKKNKRVLVELGNMMAVATAYIPPAFLEKIQ